MNKLAFDYILNNLQNQNLFHPKVEEYTEEEKEKISKILPDYGWKWDEFTKFIETAKFKTYKHFRTNETRYDL